MFSHKTDGDSGLAIRFGSLLLLIAIWALGAQITNDPQVLPGPITVVALMIKEAASGELFAHLSATLFRVICAFVLAMGIGVATGLLMGRREATNRWLDTWLIVLLNLPALVTIVLCYLWIGLTEIAAISAVAINKIPLVIVMIREGARAFETRLDDLARVFSVTGKTRLLHIILPQLAPHMAAASRAGLALIWKIVLVVEFLGRPNGVGFQIHLGFQLFDIALVLAYALAFIIVMLLVEACFVQPLERYTSRWRRA